MQQIQERSYRDSAELAELRFATLLLTPLVPVLKEPTEIRRRTQSLKLNV
jgi:hypothetical protein